MKVRELMEELDQIAPFAESESWDNTGLLVGDMQDEVTGILTTLDCAKETVDEAISKGANVIIAHHPLIFAKMDAVVESGIGRIVRQLIRNDINLIAMHTNLDHQPDGVSHMIAEKLGYTDTEVLISNERDYKKLRVTVPKSSAEQLKKDLAAAGAGNQGEYSECFFEHPITGQFRPSEGADPHIGDAGRLEQVEEYMIEAIFEVQDEKRVMQALIASHPYEEPAYDVLSLKLPSDKGLGVSFDFNGSLTQLASLIEDKTGSPIVNMVAADQNEISKVGIIGGSGMSYVEEAFGQGIDVLVTGDVKYHEAYDAKLAGRNIIDGGHYMESVMAEGLKALIEECMTVEVHATEVSTNPFAN
ncbi:Nif3-like dinuclear metal center hexameric protein [Salinicoccus sp. CNSTN-B1]